VNDKVWKEFLEEGRVTDFFKNAENQETAITQAMLLKDASVPERFLNMNSYEKQAVAELLDADTYTLSKFATTNKTIYVKELDISMKQWDYVKMRMNFIITNILDTLKPVKINQSKYE